MDSDSLIQREVDSVDFPDRMFMCGGAGIQIGLELFDRDWIQVETMRARDSRLRVDFIDTATKEEPDTVREINELNQDASRLESTMRDELDIPVSSLKLEPNYITKNIRVDNLAQITGPELVDRVRRNTDADGWWLNGEHVIDPNTPGDLYNFSRGAIRQRAVGKAFHYKALAEDAEYRRLFDLIGSDSDVGIFAGLAGGTGSGIAIDIARYIKENNNAVDITLFATLPDLSETNNEKANGFAALSELEDIQLNPDVTSPFSDIVLIPTDPTDHSGERTDEALLQLDDAIAYTVLGYYNKGMDAALKGTSAFAPFTVAVPQVLRYNVEAINEARDRTAEMLKKKRIGLNNEYQMLTDLDDLVDSHYPGGLEDDPELTNRDVDIIKDRIQQFRQLLDFEIFHELEWDFVDEEDGMAPEMLRDIFGREEYPDTDVDQLLGDNSVDEVIGLIDQLKKGGYEAGEIEEMGSIKSELLERIAYEELHHISMLYTIRRKARRDTIENSVQELLLFYTNPDKGRGTRLEQSRRLGEQIDDTEEKVQTTNQEISQIQLEIDDRLDKLESEVNDRTQSFYSATNDDIEQLTLLSQVDLRGDAQALVEELRACGNDIQTAENPTDVYAQQVFTHLEILQEATEDLPDVDFRTEADSIEQSLDLLRQTRERWDDLQDAAGGGIGIPFIGGDDDIQDEKGAYRGVKNKLERLGIFEVSNVPSSVEKADFRVDVQYDPTTTGNVLAFVDTARENARDNLKNRFRNDLRELGDKSLEAYSEYLDQFDRALEEVESQETFREEIDEILKDTYTDCLSKEVPELRADLENKKTVLDESEERLQRLEMVENALYPQIDREEEFRESHKSFLDDLHSGTQMFEGIEQESRHELENLYVHPLTPPNVAKTLTQDSLQQTQLFNNENERNDVASLIKKKLMDERIFNTQFNALRKNRLAIPKSTFTDTHLNFAVFTPAYDESGQDSSRLHPEQFDVEGRLQEHFDIDRAAAGERQVFAWNRRNGGPWDIGTCAFIQGICFLDNIREVAEGGSGYRQAYGSKMMGQEDERVRHVHSLHEGYYVRRNEVKNLEDDPGFFISDEQQVYQDLMELSERVHLPEFTETDAEATSEASTAGQGADDVDEQSQVE